MRSRYESIDAARGLAALAVVAFHVMLIEPNAGAHSHPGPARHYIPLGPAAVAVFFVISGYCIAVAATTAARRGSTFVEFMGRRARRIWPPYLLAVLAWAGTRVLKIALGGENDLHLGALVWLENLTLTQWLANARPFSHGEPVFFFLTAWSLCFEEQFYLIMGITSTTALRGRMRTLVFVLAAAGLAWNVVNVGGMLFVNLWPMFALGVLAHASITDSGDRRLRRASWALAGAGCAGIAFLHRNLSPDGLNMTSVAVLAAFAFAVLLVVGYPYDRRFASTRVGRALCAFGAMSYSLYLVHYSFRSFVYEAVGRSTHWRLPTLPFWAAEVVLHVGIAAAFWFVAERPFLVRREAAPALVAPEAP